jgi:hypothetical protein
MKTKDAIVQRVATTDFARRDHLALTERKSYGKEACPEFVKCCIVPACLFLDNDASGLPRAELDRIQSIADIP